MKNNSDMISANRNNIYQDAIDALFEENKTIDTHIYNENADKDKYPLEETEDGLLILNLNIEELPLPYYENYHEHSSNDDTFESLATSEDVPDRSQLTQDPEDDQLSSLFPYYNDFLKDIAFDNGDDVDKNNVNLTQPIVSVVELRTQGNEDDSNLIENDEIYNDNSDSAEENISEDNIIDISDEFEDLMENLSFADEVEHEEYILFPFDYVY